MSTQSEKRLTLPFENLPLYRKPSTNKNLKSKLPTAKQLVHDLTNNAQLILSYLEMDDARKALAATQESIRILLQLTRLIGTPYIGVDRRRAG